MESEQILSDAKGKVRLRWLAANALRVTHALPGSAAFPPDRPWLAQVLASSGTLPVDQGELSAELVEGCVQVRAGQNLVFGEARPARLGIRKRKPFLSVDIPKVELRAGIRGVDAGRKPELCHPGR